jgi:phosphate starvation-inducible protein PhoH and related proteins
MSARKRAELDLKLEAMRATMHKEVRFRTKAQEEYYALLASRPLVFAHGPAGTGKTFLACARAVELLARKEVDQIILVRPAVESEENLGYLPGTLDEKLEPYLTPLHDNLFRACKHWEQLQEYIEVAPLAYMRGRTFNNCVVLVDEAQNMTPDQMLMLLTRLGVRCFCFVMGDPYQNDLIAIRNGLDHAILKMRGCPLVGVQEFSNQDIVRSKLVAAVYEYWFTPEDEDDESP